MRHVMLIEDEPNIAEAVSFLLKRDGWTVSTHSNGHDAVEAVLRKKPDLIVLDVMLPGKSGFDILSDLRSGAETADVPILMLTARGQAKDRQTAAKLGATKYMTKPFSNTEILDAVNDLAQA